MAHLACDFNPVDHITVNTIGPPGKREFHFQASQGVETVNLLMEKEQTRALAASLLQLLDSLEVEQPEDQDKITSILATEMDLQYPVEPQFRIGQMGIGFDQDSGYVVIIAYELTLEEGQDIGVARFWMTREQARALAQHSLDIVEAGRPACPLCGEPMDPEGHACPRGNGHGTVTTAAGPDLAQE